MFKQARAGAMSVSAAAGVVLAGWLGQSWGGPVVTRAADDLGLLAVSLFATVCSAAAAVHARARHRDLATSGGSAGTWWALTVGLAGWSVGEVIWSYNELWLRLPQAPFPSVADIGFLALPVAAAVALWQYPARRSSQTRLRQVLDALIVTGSMFVLSWAGVLSAVYAAARSEDRLPLTVSLAYPVADFLLITMIVMLLSRAGTTDRWPLGLLCAGIVLLSVSDSVFAVLTATHPYQTGDLIDLGWVAAFLLFGWAALADTTSQAEDAPLTAESVHGRVWLPYLPLLGACAVTAHLVWPVLGHGPIPLVMLGLVLTVLVRQFITVADNQRLLDVVSHQAFHDPLTGLANRALFLDRLERAVALHHRDLRPLSVLVLDLDGFKAINDRYGHSTGDHLLIRVAERLIGCLRASDTIARLGGDEFAVLIETDPDVATLAAHRIRDALTPAFVVNGHHLTVLASIGLACASNPLTTVHGPTTAASILHDADMAMYAAKRTTPGSLQIHPTDQQPLHLTGSPASRRRSQKPARHPAG